ncbi:two pore domain potassium channel family protein [Candidatus Methylospira mobilis]|uniref:Two pore domain potassium channel family protein n=1 Tax=Candidatus Methylospira mobilis TaxID=1808979 RepID=A0A5Q0BIX0_9GAMM|nr:potassium channel family protein [Candidatus Methylospira mobilis]QFY43825.1 two pore domain potassium channel family protein [Candidatus Methylospira mobilis]WNV04817.1 potassium channel family protein [Candidatus Methylospira mobilis]
MNALSECRNAIAWISGFKVKRKKDLMHLLLLALMASVGTGVILSVIDPAIHNPFDGIWAAWGTMTHVGFGDVVPTSFFGRLLTGLLILVGIILFALFTAIISAELIGRDVHTLGNDVGRVEGAENQILHEIKRLHERLNELEKKLP